MDTPALKVKRLKPGARLPQRATEGAAGLDLFAHIDGEGSISLSRQPQLVGTGIAIEVPRGFDAQIRPRSGLSSKGVGVPLGTIDSDYRGEVLVTMYLYGTDSNFVVCHGDRIAQLVITTLADMSLSEVEELSPTGRGGGGYGSTGA